MTQLLKRAFAAASRLPDLAQDAFASLLLAEFDSEQLSALADEALREFETNCSGYR